MLRTMYTLLSLAVSDSMTWIKGYGEFQTLRYLRALRMGNSIRSTSARPYQIRVYPGAFVCLPVGDYIILREENLPLQHSSVSWHALSTGNYAYNDLAQNKDPSFIWLIERYNPTTTYQLTTTNLANQPIITHENLDESRDMLERHFSEVDRLRSYSLDLVDLHLSGWPNECLVQKKRSWHKGVVFEEYSIVIQERPFELVISVDCPQGELDQHTNRVVEIARSYYKLPD